MKSIKAGIDLKRMTTDAESFNSGNFAWGYYNPAYIGLIPASAFTKVSSCSILKSVLRRRLRHCRAVFLFSFRLSAAIAATQPGGAPGDGNFPPYTFAQNPSPTNDDHIKEDTPAPFVQMDFDTMFDGMRFRALAGLRYEQSYGHCQQSAKSADLDHLGESHRVLAPTTRRTPPTATCTTSYDEFLPSLDTSLQVLPDVLLRASYSKTIARSDL